MVRDLRTEHAISDTLDRELAQEPSTALVSVDVRPLEGRRRGALDGEHAARDPAGARRADPEGAVDARSDEPVRLFVRCT